MARGSVGDASFVLVALALVQCQVSTPHSHAMAAMAAMAAMDSDAKLSMHDLDQRSSASGEAHPSPALVFGRSPLRSASVSRPPARSLGSNASPVLPPPRPHARSLSQLSRTFTLSSTELEAPPPTRWQRAQQTCSAISDARPTMVAMGLVTVFALFGDDVRLAWLPPSADLGFLVATFAAMTLSFAEVAVNVVGKRESYLWSFVFFMDLLTASSLLVDCSMLWVGQSAVEGADTLRRIGRLGAQAGRLVRIVRLVRLVRLNRVLAAIERVRAMRKESQRKSASGSQGAGNGSSGRRATQPSMVGRRYADASSRAVVLLVLLLYVIFSIVHDADTHAVSHKKSLVLLHRMPQDRNVSREVFKWSVQSFALSSQQLLYFRVCSTGCAQTYTSAELQGWAEEAGGSGYVTPSELSTQYRREELVSLYLDQCYEGGQRVVRGTLCESTAVYSVQAASRDDAVRSILRTLLLGSVMFLSALAFVLDAQQLVIGPIERMTGLVRALGDNPLVCVQLGLENQKFMQQPKQRKGCTHAAIAMARRKGKQPVRCGAACSRRACLRAADSRMGAELRDGTAGGHAEQDWRAAPHWVWRGRHGHHCRQRGQGGPAGPHGAGPKDVGSVRVLRHSAVHGHHGVPAGGGDGVCEPCGRHYARCRAPLLWRCQQEHWRRVLVHVEACRLWTSRRPFDQVGTVEPAVRAPVIRARRVRQRGSVWRPAPCWSC